MPRLRLLLSALALWLLFLAVAVVFGALRMGLLQPRIGEPAAHVIGTLVVTAIFLIIFTFVHRIRASIRDILLIGVLWIVLTVCFEFVFGHFVAGHPWDVLLADYNVLQGRIWVLVLAALLLGPPAIGMWLKRREAR